MGTISLNGPWLFCADELNIGVEHAWQSPEFEIQNREQSMQVEVPHNWNLIPEMDRYEGVAWYFKEIPISDLGEIEGKECFLQFYGVNYDATAWLNGNKLGEHEGGFLPFRFAIPKKLLQPENRIAVRVENLRRPDRIPAMNFDWHNWGGIHRSVAILVQDFNRVNYAHVETITLAKARAILRVKYNVIGITSFTWQVIGEDGSSIEASGQEQPAGPKGDFQVEIHNPQVWDLGQPHLYTLILMPEMSREEYLSRFGIRTVGVRGIHLLLNGRAVKLKGVNLHEESLPYGRHYPRDLRERDLRGILSLGFNALRSAHYPHDEMLPELCDELGIALLEEIPVYWDCDFANPQVFRLAARMLRDLIYRDFNHPSVIAWSCGNEIPVERLDCDRFMRQAMAWVRKLDTSRIDFYVGIRMWCDQTRRAADVCGINEYFGWYYLTTRVLSGFLDTIAASRLRAPWIITEFGGDAKFGFRDPSKDPAKFSEDKQAAIIADQIRTLNAKPYVAGWFIWIYRDFRSPLRTNQYQQGFNRKGLVSDDNEQKLIARVIPKIVNQVNLRVKAHFGAAVIIQFFARYIEKAIYLASAPLISWVQKRQSAKFYLNSPVEANQAKN